MAESSEDSNCNLRQAVDQRLLSKLRTQYRNTITMAATTVRRSSTPGTAEGAPARFDTRLSASEDVELRPLPKPTRRTNDDFLDEQFVMPPPKVCLYTRTKCVWCDLDL